MINQILQWAGIVLLLIIALGLTFGWFGKKQTGCNCCEFKDKCEKNKKDC